MKRTRTVIAVSLMATMALLFAGVAHSAWYSGNFCPAASVPATCQGGQITADTGFGTPNSCRYILCSGVGQQLGVKVCLKPTDTDPSYFEMYTQGGLGSSNLRVCIGYHCVDGYTGYASSSCGGFGGYPGAWYGGWDH